MPLTRPLENIEPMKNQVFPFREMRGVLRDTGMLLPVTVDSFSISPDWFSLQLRPTVSPLIRWHTDPDLFTPLSVGAVWGYINFDKDSVRGYIWKVFFGNDYHDAVMRACETDQEIVPGALFKLADLICEHRSFGEIPPLLRAQAICRPIPSVDVP